MKFKKLLLYSWIAAIAIFASMHFSNLRADFPNYSRWMDWSKYTDEGWYGNAAIEYFVRGSWFVPGDFNCAAALPVWPFLEWILFHFTGVSLQAARALAVSLFVCNLVLAYALLRANSERWVALLGTSLIAASSFFFCFSRLAILEPLLICLTLLSLLIAGRAAATTAQGRRLGLAALMGVLYCLMVLTKTTALFLLPAILYALWYPQRKNLANFLRSAAAMGATAGLLFSAYFAMVVRHNYLQDYRYLFLVNVYTKPTTILGWIVTFYYSVHGALWVDRTLVLLALAMVVTSLLIARSLWSNPLFVSSLLAVAGYFFFIGFHNNMQPRYYAVVAVFVFFIVALAAAALLRANRAIGSVAVAVIVFSLVRNAQETIRFVRQPEFTFVNAARDLTRYMDAHPNGNRLLLSISGNDITLITGLPSICDDFGTLDLPSRLQKYQPGYYAAWNDLDPGTLEDLHTQYWLEQVATFPAFDDSDRNQLVLFKLHPRPADNPDVADLIRVPIE
ncbi:MAG TPA: glycosyltransferase family 39 protein [Acidisarcina sp.]|nr:glycosyltransferase family 39 protein [Acidisarcina sp.]